MENESPEEEKEEVDKETQEVPIWKPFSVPPSFFETGETKSVVCKNGEFQFGILRFSH